MTLKALINIIIICFCLQAFANDTNVIYQNEIDELKNNFLELDFNDQNKCINEEILIESLKLPPEIATYEKESSDKKNDIIELNITSEKNASSEHKKDIKKLLSNINGSIMFPKKLLSEYNKIIENR